MQPFPWFELKPFGHVKEFLAKQVVKKSFEEEMVVPWVSTCSEKTLIKFHTGFPKQMSKLKCMSQNLGWKSLGQVSGSCSKVFSMTWLNKQTPKRVVGLDAIKKIITEKTITGLEWNKLEILIIKYNSLSELINLKISSFNISNY